MAALLQRGIVQLQKRVIFNATKGRNELKCSRERRYPKGRENAKYGTYTPIGPARSRRGGKRMFRNGKAAFRGLPRLPALHQRIV
ncbi:MAG: hypothetical protein ACQEUH_01650 [Pseudomonadota bacterium]